MENQKKKRKYNDNIPSDQCTFEMVLNDEAKAQHVLVKTQTVKGLKSKFFWVAMEKFILSECELHRDRAKTGNTGQFQLREYNKNEKLSPSKRGLIHQKVEFGYPLRKHNVIDKNSLKKCAHNFIDAFADRCKRVLDRKLEIVKCKLNDEKYGKLSKEALDHRAEEMEQSQVTAKGSNDETLKKIIQSQIEMLRLLAPKVGIKL